MCGFTCIITNDNENKSEIDHELLKHRGPDYVSTINHLNLKICHWRLSIIDLTPNSDQPIQDNKYIFAYNGEIYDHDKWISKHKIDELGDTRKVFEIIKKTKSTSALYDEPGFFSLLFYDKINRTITGTRDKFGKKPLYYYFDKQIFVLSSEEKGILPFINIKSVNKSSINNYFLYKERFHGETIFERICELAPGAEINFNIREWCFKINYDWNSYYNNKYLLFNNCLKEAPNQIDYCKQAFEEKFRALFKKSVLSRLSTDVPVQLALSGGIDSFMIGEAIMESKMSNKLLRSITVDFETSSEALIARKNSEYLNIINSTIKFNDYNFLDVLETAIEYNSGPLEHPHSLAYYLMCQNANLKGKILITGEGADELLFGYNHYINFDKYSFAFREFLRSEDEIIFGENSFNEIRNISNVKNLRDHAISNMLNSRTMEYKTHLLSLLRRNDRMGMANSIEIRSPFIDPRLIDFILRSNFLSHYKNKKQFMNSIFKNNLITNNILNMSKIGFRVPFDEFFHKNKNSERVKSAVDLGLQLIRETCDLNVLDHKKINFHPRLAWVLINLGLTKKLFFS